MEFEAFIKQDLHRFLTATGAVDEKLPECPDLDEIWDEIASAYLPDGVREFLGYPLTSLGWPMFTGMAAARFWDEDWMKYNEAGGGAIYTSLRDACGFDNMDDYILERILCLPEEEAKKRASLAGECAARVLSAISHSRIEPGTPEALNAYRISIRELYRFGVAIELNNLGYHMTAIG